MPHADRYGLALSTSFDAAAFAYRDGMDLMLSAWPGASEAFDRAIAADPDFALAHIARARMHFIYAEVPEARVKSTQARTLVAQHGDARERSHVDIIALSVEGKPVECLAGTLAHLDRWPRDAIIMSLPLGAFGLFAFSGMADHEQAKVDLLERHKSYYGDDWWFLTYLGWSHAENRNVAHGRGLIERAFAARRENANAMHSLAHAMFEDGSAREAEAIIRDWLPSYDRSGILHGHISWHEALAALERDDAEAALAIYADRIAPHGNTAPPINVVTDGAALLWRAGLEGHPVPRALWSETATNAVRFFPKSGNAFIDVHVALAAAATGDAESLDRRADEIEARLAQGKLPPGPVVPAILRAIRAFANDDYATCAKLLEPVAADVVRIGGSHAQREMIEDTLILAQIKNGESAKARALLDERLHRRPSARDERWRAAAQNASVMPSSAAS
ncbi:hypothetical protein GJW-30_1_02397 [Variibacter gotjawalensis]|uniref:Tetratricopeptide repeat protein 38 n=1 Tax=Variibacter gotjawalensis TaxID=1333996 RepID=A0A0S3PV73_9BRAD|nr:tetratricopeptide repeat protein [Variibacter gotjawalensis]NIK50190.1 tetratricopeptide (TPR) repeat protein [Variibacter gotjawalensis]RZS46187.1 hypothetical protein EV661_4518 [Variibacter gotjawalensis]BAT59862.1 hypothetical protein GJW-30_1_02397 [Variibacter gotjawalensis]